MESTDYWNIYCETLTGDKVLCFLWRGCKTAGIARAWQDSKLFDVPIKTIWGEAYEAR